MRSPKGRRTSPAGPSVCLALLLLTGCAVGSSGSSDVSDTPRRDLAGRPAASVAAGSAAAATAAPSRGIATGAGQVQASTSTQTEAAVPAPPAGGGGTARPSPASSYHRVVALNDGAHDQGAGAPSYADLRGVLIQDDGGNARVTVTLGGNLPARAAAGEAIGIGVDFYQRATQTESDYQLFADGGPDGWFAYLSTPKGFVRYPGSFALAGAAMTWTVPWSSLGGPTSGRFSAFCDWTQRRTTGNAAGNDRAPLLGNTAYAR